MRPRWGIDLFLEEGAYTSLTAAVSMLMVFALTFSVASAAWVLARSGDVQVAADATALSGANVVSSYHTAATVVDASILTLGLTGMCTLGVGMAGLFIPGAAAAAEQAVEAGLRMIELRNDFAASASNGLSTLEKALPYLVAAAATRTCAAQSSERISYAGTALAIPRASASEFPALDEVGVPTDSLRDASHDLGEVARARAEASKEAEQDKRRAWEADCGRSGMCMWERAGHLSGISEDQNPRYASSLTWNPTVGLNRARAYYRWRKDHDPVLGKSVKAQADAAARRAFYAFASQEMEASEYQETDEEVIVRIPLLPRNIRELKESTLYSEAMWPSTYEDGKLTLHYGSDCPGAPGAPGALLPISATDTSEAAICSICSMSTVDLGRVPAASTSIENGFEYHLREFTEALKDYETSRNKELALERQAKKEAEGAADAFEDALSRLAGKRPRIAPPGRKGCVALVGSGALEEPSVFSDVFAPTPAIGSRGAIAAAVLAPDPATRENNMLGLFFSNIERQAGASPVVGIVGSVLDLWGDLLISYGDIAQGADALLGRMMGGLDMLGAGPLARWLGDRVRSIMRGIGLEPVDLSYRKPVLCDTSLVLAHADMPGLSNTQDLIRSIPLSTTDPSAILAALGYEAEKHLAGEEIVLAELPLPGGGSIPLAVRVGDVVGGQA
ncbi:hypothetical protein K6V98_02435 [Collinsella sp. AGMB00827]|uniref:Molybdenum cofactor biosynthesis enzyme n=1 Tax=Collinsella ureilytica TaxID=2869515 RepID=A0ABS7MIM6_9ACTN|nr:hypothetical protein [Collinsella urealyticum]